MPLDPEDARKLLRAEFNLDVADNDPLLAPYMLGQLSLDHMKPELEEMGAEVAAGIIQNSKGVLEKSHASLVEVATQVATMKDAMKVNVEFAEKSERLNDMLDEKFATFDKKFTTLDEKFTALDERIDRTEALAKKMTEMADKTVQAVVALTRGLLKIQPKSMWKK